MSDGIAATSSAPAPANGATNGASGGHAPAVPPASPSPSSGAGAVARAPDGRFVSSIHRAPAPEKPPEPPAPTKEEAQAQAYRFRRKLQVNGREEEVDLSEEDIERELQIGRASGAKFKEAKAIERDAMAVLEQLKSNPVAALRQAGVDVIELAKQELSRHAQRELMDPNERRAAELEEKLQALEAEKKAQAEAEAKRQQEEHSARLWEHIGPQFSAAMEEAGIPRNRFTLREISKVGLEFLDLKLALNPKQVVAEAKKRMSQGHESYLEHLDAKALRQKLGQARVRELIQLELDEYKKSQDFAPAPRTERVAIPETREPPTYIDEYEFARRRRGG